MTDLLSNQTQVKAKSESAMTLEFLDMLVILNAGKLLQLSLFLSLSLKKKKKAD